MVGLSHVAFRLLLREYLPSGAHTLWATEMLNSWKLPIEPVGRTAETLRAEFESDLAPQILGNEERPIAESVRRLEDWGAVAIDINMGCPVQKALKHNYGVALMGDANYAAEVVAMTVRNARVPVSVKLRAGHQNDPEYLLKFMRGLESAGASWLTLHPRTASQKRRGSADWSQIAEIKREMKIPIWGNGDVQTADDVFAMLEETKCDMVMVGRALTARPWLFWQVGDRLGFAPPTGREGQAPPSDSYAEGAEYGRALLRLTEIFEEYFISPLVESGRMTREQANALAFRKFSFYVRTSMVWLQFGQALYSEVTSVRDANFVELRSRLENFFAAEQSMSARTQLRQ